MPPFDRNFPSLPDFTPGAANPRVPPPPPVLAWAVEVALPLDGRWSKNTIWRSWRGRHVLAPWAVRRRDALATALVAAMSARGAIARQNRYWVALHALKPHHGMDAGNVLDLALDAVVVATGVDDRWAALAGLTWEVVPGDPTLVVRVGQEDLPDVACCDRCGGTWPAPKARSGRLQERGHCPTCAVSPRPRRIPRGESMPPADPRRGDPPPW